MELCDGGLTPAQSLAMMLVPGPKLPAPVIRAQIATLEAVLSALPGAVFGNSDLCPVRHTWVDGIYTREITIPKGVVLTGQVHKHAHPNFLMVGEVLVVTEFDGLEHLRAPVAMVSAAGTKRAVVALQDTIWITVHHCAAGPLDGMESQIVAPTYADYDAWRATQEEEPP